jgi:BirA family transcriptional regulator, biotin operon repressor / biotin---[acetyl-CoA-carboxylase] ligase
MLFLFRPLLVFDEIGSTNSYMKEKHQELEPYTVVQALFQTQGRGQFDRTWISNKAENLMFSILFKHPIGFSPDLMNPIIVMALISSLKDYGINAYYKEPNDIYVNGKKIAGILIETKYDHRNLKYMVVGIGLNVNQIDFQELNATSMKNCMNDNYDLGIVLTKILIYIENNVLLQRMIQGDKDDIND